MDTPCEDCEKLKKEIVELKAQIEELTGPVVTINEPVKEPTAEETPKRKYNKK